MFDIQKGRGLMKQQKRVGILLMLVCLIITLALPVTANAAVKINKTSVSVLRGKTYNLKITGTKKKIKWTSSNKKIATVSASGKIKGIKKGRCNIYAKVGKKKYTCKVTVKQPVTSIKLSKKSISLNKGKKYTLKARIAPKSAANKAVMWKSSNTKIASVSSKGVVTAKSAGTTTITATAKDGSRKKASCKVTIKGSSNKKILIQELKFDIKERIIELMPAQYKDTSKYWVNKYVGREDYYYDPIIFPSNATNKTLSWKSSNTNVATVDTKGNITALRAGTTIISASTTDGSKKTISYKATVIGGKENFMEIDMTKKENLEKYLKRASNRSYTENIYDSWTGEKTGERKHHFLFENPLYSQGWRCVGISADYEIIMGHEQEESYDVPKKAIPYEITVTNPAEMNMEILQAKGKLVFYNIRGGDLLGTEEFYPSDKKIYNANPY